MQLIKYEINEKGNLEISINISTFSYGEFLEENVNLDFNSIWQKLIANTELIWVKPETVGALTNAPILMWNKLYYWYPEYEVINELELLKNQKVEFSKI